MIRKIWRFALFFGVFLTAIKSPLSATPGPPQPPRLIVFICVDQFRYDYYTKYESFFTDKGFRYLTDRGAFFTDCNYQHATLVTAVGHSIMMSGAYPNATGLISNDWYDRRTGRMRYAVEDQNYPILGDTSADSSRGRSPMYFIGSNFADIWKWHTNGKGKVFAVSNKDRSAIMMAGKLADGAYWWDYDAGNWITSTYYRKAYPSWVSDFNLTRPLDKWFNRSWPLFLHPRLYPERAAGNSDYYLVQYDMQKDFPHRIGSESGRPDRNYYLALRTSPFGVEAVNDFIKILLDNENLGSDAIPDLLCISYSSGDYLGHAFGPDSREIMDFLIRCDRYLADIINYINKKTGENQVLYILTADHGVAPIPMELNDEKFPAGYVHRDSVRLPLERHLIKRYGNLATAHSYLLAMEPDFYFNDTALIEKNIDKYEIQSYIKGCLTETIVPKGVYRLYFKTDILEGRISRDKLSDQITLNTHPERSGDFYVVLEPYFMWYDHGKGTEHGAPYRYDTHVPLWFSGSQWIKPGIYRETCSPADIVPTLAALLGATAPSQAVGRVLTSILK